MTAADHEMLESAGMSRLAAALRTAAERADPARSHGDWPRWQNALTRLPGVTADEVRLDDDTVTAGRADALTPSERAGLVDVLKCLMPWRKGPFCLFGVTIDSEWRSDMKWRRVRPHVEPLTGKSVLDVGCGNGYFLWRLAAAGAFPVLGIDPAPLFSVQYAAVRRYAGARGTMLRPLTLESFPRGPAAFDTVLSMGVLYHRRSPFDHLYRLRECLKPGGQLVLETLVTGGGQGAVLVPRGRYAKMRNVWFIPSPEALVLWLERSGFRDAVVVDVTPTTTAEQRSTEWMTFESLPDFLAPGDPSRTVEGYPAPVRAVLTAMAC